MTSRGVDQAITELFLDAVSAAKVEIALAAVGELQSRREEALRQWDAELQQAEYNVQLPRRRYEAADPDNRLVAAALGTRWEEAMRDLQQRQRDRQEFINGQQLPLSARDERFVKELSGGLAAVWHAETTTMEDRKKVLRFLIRRMHLDGVRQQGKIRLEVEWHTGAHRSLVIDRPPVGVWAPKTPADFEQRIEELLPDHDQATMATTRDLRVNALGTLATKARFKRLSSSFASGNVLYSAWNAVTFEGASARSRQAAKTEITLDAAIRRIWSTVVPAHVRPSYSSRNAPASQ
jgi:hypothetical protein